MSYRMLYLLLQAVALCGMMGWFYWAFIFFRAPRIPDATHVVAMHNHGAIIYFTQAQAAFGPGCFILSILSGAASMFFYNRAQWPQKQ